VKADLQRWVQRSGWDRAAPHYERYWQEQLQPAHDALLDLAALRPGEHVLDVACGTGLVTLRAARHVGPSGRVTGTDVSSKMIGVARTRAADAALDNVQFECADAEQLGAVPQFDVALCALGLMYLPDPVRALTEMRRSVAPGGRVIVGVWGERRRCGWAGVFPIVDARVASDVCPLFFALGAPGALRGAMAASGLEQLQELRITPTLRYPDADSAIGAAFVGGPVALAYARFDEPTRNEAGIEYLESISPFRCSVGGYEIPAEFVIAAGRRPIT
jgi:SAM-dependent methyltransferase